MIERQCDIFPVFGEFLSSVNNNVFRTNLYKTLTNFQRITP